MKLKILQKLTQKIQLEMTEKELISYLENFEQIEKLVESLKKTKTIKPMDRINTGYLTLTDLEKLKKISSKQRINKKILKSNAKTTSDKFILFRKQKIS